MYNYSGARNAIHIITEHILTFSRDCDAPLFFFSRSNFVFLCSSVFPALDRLFSALPGCLSLQRFFCRLLKKAK